MTTKRPLPILTIVLVLGVLFLAFLAFGAGPLQKYREDATYPTNRIAKIVRDLANQCPQGKLVEVIMSPRFISVSCTVNDRGVHHIWSYGSRSTEDRSLDPNMQEFTLTDFNLDGAARLAAEDSVSTVNIIAGTDGLRVAQFLDGGRYVYLTPDLQPLPR